METVDCPVCGSGENKAVFPVGRYRIVRCESCGLRFLNPRPDGKELSQIYAREDYYTRGEDRHGYRDYRAEEPFWRHESRHRIAVLGKLVHPGKILDVGCAHGFFLDEARSAGWDPVGIEISAHSSDWARRELKLDVKTGSLPDIHQKLEPGYRAVTLWDTLEHLSDPLDVLLKASSLLASDGIIAVSCPAADSPMARLTGRFWWQIKAYHLFYFSDADMEKMMGKAGLEIIHREHSLAGLGNLTGIPKLTGLAGRFHIWDTTQWYARKSQNDQKED